MQQTLSPKQAIKLVWGAGRIMVTDRTTCPDAGQYGVKILEAAPDALVIVDESGKIVLTNEQASRLFGYSQQELLALGVDTLLPEALRCEHAKHRKAYIQSPHTRPMGIDMQLQAQRRDGSLFPVEISLSPLPTPEGMQVISIIRDVTVHRRMESLQVGLNKVLRFIAGGQDLTAVLTTLVQVFEEQIDGVMGSVLLLQDGRLLHHAAGPSLPDAYNRGVDGLVIGPQVGSCGSAAYHKKRVIVEDIQTDPRWAAYRELAATYGLMACWSQPILSTLGTVLGTFALYYRTQRRPNTRELDLITSAADIAAFAIEHIQARDRLCESEARLQQIANTIDDVFWMTDCEDFSILFASPSYETIWGRPLADLYNDPRNWIEGIHPEDRQQVEEAFLGVMEAGHYEEEFRVVRPDGSMRWVRDRGYPVRDTAERVVRIVGIAQDITDLKAKDAEIYRAYEVLEQRVQERTAELAVAKGKAEEADRLKSAFLAAMSHELRTPLNSIIGFTGILLQELAGPLGHEQRKQLTMVQGSSRHLLSLINDVLDISKIEAGQLELFWDSFNVRQLIEKIKGQLLPLAQEKGLTLRVTIASDVGCLRSDARRIEQILINLINNAIKFTEMGVVGVDCTVVDSGLRIRVSDTGTGIRPEDFERIFQPFQQIDSGLGRRAEGTGLGLSICKRLAEMLGGRIGVESQWQKGSTFTLDLPKQVQEGKNG